MARSAKQLARNPAPFPRGIVGTVHDPAGLKAAARLRRGAVDLLELRVDAFAGQESALLAAARNLGFPLLVTVRSPAEGAVHPLPTAARAESYHRFLDVAAVIDVELSSLPALRAVVEEARRRGVGVVLSFHDFTATPTLARLRALARRAVAAGADCFKCATRLRSPSDLHALHQLLLTPGVRIPVAAMGMGPGAPAARLVLGAAGSALNYGFLHRPNAPGQLPATLLKPLLELLAAAEVAGA